MSFLSSVREQTRPAGGDGQPAPKEKIARPRLKPSITASVNATERACEMALPPDQRLFEDPFAKMFIQKRWYRWLASWGPLSRLSLRVFDRIWPGAHAIIIMRYRPYEEMLTRALDEGVEQIVLLGAGYDSTSLRRDLRGAVLYEVDTPHTQGAKRRTLERNGIEPPNEVVYVPCDFEVQLPSERLAESGFDASKPSLVAWFGVLYYLSNDAAHQTLADVAKLSATGSHFVFDYMDASVIDGTTKYPGAIRAARAVKRRGEPYTFGLTRESARALVEEYGFQAEENLRIKDLFERWGPPGGVWCSDDDWFGLVIAKKGAA